MVLGNSHLFMNHSNKLAVIASHIQERYDHYDYFTYSVLRICDISMPFSMCQSYSMLQTIPVPANSIQHQESVRVNLDRYAYWKPHQLIYSGVAFMCTRNLHSFNCILRAQSCHIERLPPSLPCSRSTPGGKWDGGCNAAFLLATLGSRAPLSGGNS